MTRLLLMRHGKSDWDVAVDDHERPLNQRGEQAAADMGRFLTAIGETPDLVVSSSAVRARTTAQIATDAGAWGVAVTIEPSLYLPAPATVFDVAERRSEGVARLLLVGHQPAWGDVVAELTGARVAMKTATVAIIENGILEALLQPRHITESGRLKPRGSPGVAQAGGDPVHGEQQRPFQQRVVLDTSPLQQRHL